MFRPLEKFADMASVVASGIATADLPAAGTYYTIWLHCLDGGAAVSLANIKADILNVKLTLNGTTFLEASSTALYAIYEEQYAEQGAVPRAGMLPITLAPDHLERTLDSDQLALGMGGITALQLELTLGAATATAGHVDQIAVYVERLPTTRPVGTHRKLLKFARSFASAGVQEITDLPFEAGSDAATAAYHLLYNGAAAVITDLEFIVNNQTIRKYAPLAAQSQNEKAGRKWMVAGAAGDLFSIPFDLSGDLTGYLGHEDVYDLRMRTTWSAAPNAYEIYRESYHGRGKPNYNSGGGRRGRR
jgi:hypothetical protein